MPEDIKKELQEEEIVIVEDEQDLTAPDEDPDNEPDDEPDEDDERVAQDDDDEPSEDDDEREAIRERRRQEKKERKERREQAIKRDKTEMEFLRKRNDDLERRLTAQEQRAHTSDLGAFDNAIAQASKDAEMAERVIAKAVEAGNGDDVATALKYRDEARTRVQQLAWQKQQAAQKAPQPKQQGMDETVVHYASEFIKENPWYDQSGRNEDSAIVIAIDQTLANEGYDPKSEDYWTELRKRAAKRLPDRFGKPAKRESRGGPAVGSSREHAPTSTRKEIYISPERKEALIEAGVWDDPVLRMKYVKRYAEYDRANKK